MFISYSSQISCHFSVIILEQKLGLVTGLPKAFLCHCKAKRLGAVPTESTCSFCLAAAPPVALHLLLPLTPSPGEPLLFLTLPPPLSACTYLYLLASLSGRPVSPSLPHGLYTACFLHASEIWFQGPKFPEAAPTLLLWLHFRLPFLLCSLAIELFALFCNCLVYIFMFLLDSWVPWGQDVCPTPFPFNDRN